MSRLTRAGITRPARPGPRRCAWTGRVRPGSRKTTRPETRRPEGDGGGDATLYGSCAMAARSGRRWRALPSGRFSGRFEASLLARPSLIFCVYLCRHRGTGELELALFPRLALPTCVFSGTKWGLSGDRMGTNVSIWGENMLPLTLLIMTEARSPVCV